MIKKLIPIAILICSSFWGIAQSPEAIRIQEWGMPGINAESMACADQFAGTISFANFAGQTNDIDLDTLYFCFNDQIDIVHNGDMDLTGDPNTITEAGVTYGIFSCEPTMTGPNLAGVLTEPCIVSTPAPMNDLWVTQGGAPSGDITFFNDGNLQTTFNAGDPILLWFAPLTIDDFTNKGYEVDPVTSDVGPCVNLNVDEAFAVVYLNEMLVTNETTMNNGALCQGAFRIQGGLPEFDINEVYDITITNLLDPTVTGDIISGAASHLETVVFNVPTAGLYQVVIEDGKSCGLSFIMNFSACVSVAAEMPDVTVAPGTNICIDVTNVSNFFDMQSLQFSLVWDETVLQFDQVTNLNPNMPGLTSVPGINFIPFGNDALIFSWFDTNPSGVSLPNGDVYFSICFNVIGGDGDCSDVSFSSSPSVIEATNINNIQVGFDGTDGSICLMANNLNIGFVQDSIDCFGDSNGSFTTTVDGGTAPYQVSWQPLAGGAIGGPGIINIDGGSFTASNLTAGPYSVTISDDIGATTIDTVEVLGPEEMVLLINEFEPLCFGDMGQLEVEVTRGGTLLADLTGYTIAWSSGDDTFTTDQIPAGFYSVTVTDPTGCIVTMDNVLLAQPPEITINFTFDTATCSGITDGGIDLFQVLGGTPDANLDYTIFWKTIAGGITFTNNMSNVSGLPGDEYPLCITDSNGCEFRDTLEVPVFKQITLNTITHQNVLCYGTDSGELELVGTTSGAPPSLPYNFIWQGSPPPPPSVDDATSTLLAGLDAGTYAVTMQDATGCEIDTLFEITEPPMVGVDSIMSNDASCTPGSDGSITVEGTGGVGGYSYMWNTLPPSVGATISGLDAGFYTVTVSDANDCTAEDSFTIINPTPPTIDMIENDTIDCFNGLDGSLTVFATPGDSPITTYEWLPAFAGQTINGLAAGEYIAIVTDMNGCIVTDTAYVIQPNELVVDSVLTQSPNCPGEGGGNISLFVSGGTGPYYYEWSPVGFMGIGVAVIGGGVVTAGDYTTIIEDANGCPPLIVQTTLEDPPGIQVSFGAFQDISCPVNSIGVDCDGGVTASAFYSDGSSGTFDFFWGSGEMDNDVPFSTAGLLCVDQNTLSVGDGSCSLDTFVVIGAPANLVVNVDPEDVSCEGFMDGSAVASPQGGTGPYTIFWDNTTGPVINGLAAGPYNLTVEDDNGCSILHTVEINEPDAITIEINQTQTQNVLCPDGMSGQIGVFAQGGNIPTLGGETYVWGNNAAPNGATIAENLTSGTYTVTVIDAKGCTAELSHTLNEPPPINFNVELLSQIGCFGEAASLTVSNVTGGNVTTYQYYVDQGIPRLIGEPAPVFAGDHTVTVRDALFGCEVDTTISIFEPLPITIDLPQIVEIELGDTLTILDPTIVSSLPIDTFLWAPPNQLSCADCKNPRVNAVEDQLYTLTIIDINGCSTTSEILVEVDRNRNVYLPNIFSPNDDGLNDKFKVYTGLGVENIASFQIYDRWGELMYEAVDLLPSVDGAGEWDGRFNGEKMKPAVFVYIIRIEFKDGTSLVYRGDVSLIR